MTKRASPTEWGVHPLALELEGHRTQHSKTFALPDGQRSMIIGRNIHYAPVPDENDINYWDDVDLTFKRDGLDYAIDRNLVRSRVTKKGIAIWDRTSDMGIIWIGTSSMAGDRKAKMNDGIVNWEYAVCGSGFKTSAPIATPIGAKTFAFLYAKMGNWRFDVDEFGNLIADWGIVPRAVFIGKSGLSYPCGPWRVSYGNKVEFDWDSNAIPLGEFPGVLDPTTTFSVAVSIDDAYINGGGATYPPPVGATDSSATTISVSRNFAGGFYDQNVGFVQWDTSALPDATIITAATMRIKVTTKSNADSRNLVAEWYPATNWPIDVSDWTTTAPTTPAASLSLTSITTSALNDLTFTNFSGINLTGYSGIRLLVDGGQPTGNNAVQFASFDHATEPEPQLIVTYGVSGGYHMMI